MDITRGKNRLLLLDADIFSIIGVFDCFVIRGHAIYRVTQIGGVELLSIQYQKASNPPMAFIVMYLNDVATMIKHNVESQLSLK